jgi:large subunit ribosomal protein L10
MREEKQFLLDEIKEKIDNSKGFIIASYKGLTANKVRQFRDIVSEAEGEFEVVRKRVFLKALEKSGIPFKGEKMEGHVGVIFAKKDAAALTKVAVKYSDDNEKALAVLGGKIEEDVYSGEEMLAISSLPGLQDLRAAFLGTIEAPMRDMVSIFGAHLTGLLYCIEEKAKKEQ